MPYNSGYTGAQIDTAIGEVQSRVWDPVTLNVTTLNWMPVSMSTYNYSLTFYVSTSDSSSSQREVRPLVWFISGTDGSRYYVDYTASTRGGGSPYYYTIVVHSNVRIAGNFMVFGHMLEAASFSVPS